MPSRYITFELLKAQKVMPLFCLQRYTSSMYCYLYRKIKQTLSRSYSLNTHLNGKCIQESVLSVSVIIMVKEIKIKTPVFNTENLSEESMKGYLYTNKLKKKNLKKRQTSLSMMLPMEVHIVFKKRIKKHPGRSVNKT